MQIKINDRALPVAAHTREGNTLTLSILAEHATAEELFDVFPEDLTATAFLLDEGELTAKYKVIGVPEAARVEGGSRVVLQILPLELTAEDRLTARVEAQAQTIQTQGERIAAQAEQIAAMSVQTDAIRAMGARTERAQSDKVGYDVVHHYLGDQLMCTTYEPQVNPVGTENNPFPWTEDALLIPNAYYMLDGVRKVWMGEKGAQGASWDDERWGEM